MKFLILFLLVSWIKQNLIIQIYHNNNWAFIARVSFTSTRIVQTINSLVKTNPTGPIWPTYGAKFIIKIWILTKFWILYVIIYLNWPETTSFWNSSNQILTSKLGFSANTPKFLGFNGSNHFDYFVIFTPHHS